MFVTNWISTTKIQKISEITNFFRHYFLSRTEVGLYDERQPVRAASYHIQQGLPVHPGSPITLVCYEKFERIETSQFQNCFTKHDFLYRESIEITTSIS